jgi:hypothetical protein
MDTPPQIKSDPYFAEKRPQHDAFGRKRKTVWIIQQIL